MYSIINDGVDDDDQDDELFRGFLYSSLPYISPLSSPLAQRIIDRLSQEVQIHQILRINNDNKKKRFFIVFHEFEVIIFTIRS